MSGTLPFRLCALAVCGTLLGCFGNARVRATGSDGAPSDGTNPAGNNNTDGAPTVDPTVPPAACIARAAGPSPVRRMTRLEYDLTMRDLLGDTRTLAQSGFVAEEVALGFNNNADALHVTSVLAQQYVEAATTLATTAVATRLPTLLGCNVATSGESTCAQRFIDGFGKRAWRRPLTLDEKARLLAVYSGRRSAGLTFNDGVRATLAVMLSAPQFLYRLETSALPLVAGTSMAAVSSYEMASRLSYFLWSSMPDDALFAAADADALQTADQVEAQARRMMADPKAHDSVANFHAQLLGLTELLTTTKDAATLPEYTDAIRAAQGVEVRTFVDKTFWSDGKLQTLLTTPATYVNPTLASFYGLPAVTGSGFSKVALDPARASGLLTQGALMTINAGPLQSSPTFRGKFLRERLICQNLPPPPDNVPVIPAVNPNQSNRDRYAAHSTDPSCAGCHTLMDPLGFGFEHYDAIGRWRQMDRTYPIDTSGAVNGTDADGPFDGAVALGVRLSGSKTVQKCVSLSWFHYANGRVETADDTCSLAMVQARLDGSQQDLRELMVALTLTDAFRFRTPGGS